jgi:hypothetical protein
VLREAEDARVELMITKSKNIEDKEEKKIELPKFEVCVTNGKGCVTEP